MEQDFGVHHFNSLIVSGVEGVGACHCFAHFGDYFAHYDAFFARNGYHIHAVASVHYLLHHGDWHYHICTGRRAKRYAARNVPIDANYLIMNTVDFNAFAARVAAVGEKFLIGFFADDAHFAFLEHIDFVDVTPETHFGTRDETVVGSVAGDANFGFSVVVDGIAAACKEHRGYDVEFVDAAFKALDVIEFHTPPTAFAETFVGFGCPLRKQHRRIGCKTREVAVEHLFHTLSAAKQRHKHKHAPKNSEASQKRAGFIPR